MSTGKAILIGTLIVNGPVFILLVTPVLALSYFISEPGILVVPIFGLGLVAAWLWWSISIPKWRLWAYARVNDINELKDKAISAGLTWPDDSLFSKTEIKSSADRLKQKEYEENA